MEHSKDDITLVVAALKQGDERAFRNIYLQYVVVLRAFVSTYTKNTPQTDDIVQDTFLKLWQTRHNLDPKKSIKSFLFTTAHHIFIDKYRKNKREATELEGWMYNQLMSMLENDEEEQVQRIQMVESAIEKLPLKQKEIFKLSKLEQLKYREIAAYLNISIKTVEVQMGKAFRFIREEVYKAKK